MNHDDPENPPEPRLRASEAQLRPELPREVRFRHDNAHLVPARWWFASSAFPMVAGTLGPVASAFSICALVRPWRQLFPRGAQVQQTSFVTDPHWLTAINALQLVVALVSNLLLLLNMAKRVRFTLAQPITIVGWYISAICLVALTATAAGPLDQGLQRPTEEYIWSEAFYYGIWAAILYFVDASLMVVTFWGAFLGYYDKDFNLTASQRTLMLQTIMVLAYLLLGALVFSKIEDWAYLDAVYWADVTLFTVGFGDFAASTHAGRALVVPYALVGIISLGLVVSSIRSLMLERGSRRLDARVQEKNRRRVLRTITRRGNDDILTPLPRELSLDADEDEADESEFGELRRRRSEFGLMRAIQNTASVRRRWLAMAISTTIWLLLWLVGAAIFRECERSSQSWTYFDSFYFCFVSLMTIGYGDRTPKSNAGKSFFVFWSLLALPTMTVLISNAGDTVVKLVRDGTIRLGNVTILPGDHGASGSPDHFSLRRACRLALSGTSGVVRGLERLARGIEKSPSGDPSVDAGPAGEPGQSEPGRPATRSGLLVPTTTAERSSLSRIRSRLDALPDGDDYRLLLISEIQGVSRHVRHDKSRRYTFEEWAWYLGLIGEDERDPQMHDKARPHKPQPRHHRQRHRRRHGNRHRHHHHHQEPAPSDRHDDGDEDDQLKWSWVGTRSPLVGGHEEGEWILERLMDRLKESLWTAAHEADDG